MGTSSRSDFCGAPGTTTTQPSSVHRHPVSTTVARRRRVGPSGRASCRSATGPPGTGGETRLSHGVPCYPKKPPTAHPPMPRPRRRPKPDRRRALELLASCRDGCTGAIIGRVRMGAGRDSALRRTSASLAQVLPVLEVDGVRSQVQEWPKSRPRRPMHNFSFEVAQFEIRTSRSFPCVTDCRSYGEVSEAERIANSCTLP
jgi:hypothetical protein